MSLLCICIQCTSSGLHSWRRPCGLCVLHDNTSTCTCDMYMWLHMYVTCTCGCICAAWIVTCTCGCVCAAWVVCATCGCVRAAWIVSATSGCVRAAWVVCATCGCVCAAGSSRRLMHTSPHACMLTRIRACIHALCALQEDLVAKTNGYIHTYMLQITYTHTYMLQEDLVAKSNGH